MNPKNLSPSSRTTSDWTSELFNHNNISDDDDDQPDTITTFPVHRSHHQPISIKSIHQTQTTSPISLHQTQTLSQTEEPFLDTPWTITHRLAISKRSKNQNSSDHHSNQPSAHHLLKPTLKSNPSVHLQTFNQKHQSLQNSLPHTNNGPFNLQIHSLSINSN